MMRKLISLIFCLVVLACAVFAADLNYPYGRISLSLPPSEIPFPGMGNGYCALDGGGIRSAVWNPALLGKLKLSEASFSVNQTSGNNTLTSTNKILETSDNLEAIGGGSGSPGGYGIFYRTPAEIGSGITTKEIEVLSSLSSGTKTTGMNFASALKVNDWLAIGFAANNPMMADIGLAGNFPVTGRVDTNFIGQKLNDNLSIESNGKLLYQYQIGVVNVTYESTAAVWGGYLSQEATIPLTSLSEFRDSFDLRSPFTGTVAAKYQKFCFGFNLVPINASANLENNVNMIVNSGTDNISIYVPNFDPTSQASIAEWVTNEAKYSTSIGYQQKQIVIPSGQIVATSKYRGYYSASTARIDLGGTYDLNDWVTIGLALENIGGAVLNFKGSGIANYFSYRATNSFEAATIGDFFLPGGNTYFNYISDRWTTSTEAGGQNLYLPPEKTYVIPKRTRIGIAVKRPILIALDYELNQSPLSLPTTIETTLTNLSFIHLGAESRVFALPLWLKFGTTLMLKPTVTNTDQSLNDSINKAFRYGVLPMVLDLGATLNLRGTEIGLAGGYDTLSLLNLLQFDHQNTDLGRTVYVNLSAKKDAWQVDLTAQTDVIGTMTAFNNRVVPAGTGKSFKLSDLRFINTLGVTYRF